MANWLRISARHMYVILMLFLLLLVAHLAASQFHLTQMFSIQQEHRLLLSQNSQNGRSTFKNSQDGRSAFKNKKNRNGKQKSKFIVFHKIFSVDLHISFIFQNVTNVESGSPTSKRSRNTNATENVWRIMNRVRQRMAADRLWRRMADRIWRQAADRIRPINHEFSFFEFWILVFFIFFNCWSILCVLVVCFWSSAFRLCFFCSFVEK